MRRLSLDQRWRSGPLASASCLSLLLAKCCLLALGMGLCVPSASVHGEALSPDTIQPASDVSSYEPEVGQLVHRYVGADSYNAHEQNWDATQDTSGIFHVANTEGILSYDGEAWRLTPTVNRSIARSIAADDQGRVFVGAQGDFGRLRRDSIGQWRHTSLLDHVPEEHQTFTDVWRTEITSEGVYFQSYRRLFRWQPETGDMQSWAPDEREFGLGGAAHDTFFVKVRDRGLMAVQDDSLQLVPGGADFADRSVIFVRPHPRHGMIVGTYSGLFVRDGTSFRRFSTDIDELLNTAWTQQATVLSDGTIAIATVDVGLLLLAPDGTLLRHLRPREKPVSSVYKDREGGLWALLDGGLMRYDLGVPFTKHGPATGLAGRITDVTRHRGTLYATTTQETYRLRTPEDSLAAFVPVPEFRTQSWTLLSVGEDLLIGIVTGLKRRGPGGEVRRLLETNHVYDLLRSRVDSSLLYVATGRGVRPVTRTEDGWTVGERVPGLDTEARTLAEADDGTLWVGTSFDGVYRIRFDETSDSTSVDHYGPEYGLPPDRVDPQRWNGELLFGTSTGLMRFVPSPEPHFAPVESIEMPPLERDEGIVRLQNDAQGRTWGFTSQGPGRWRRQDTAWAWAPGPLYRLRGPAPNALHIEDRGTVLWFGVEEDLVRYSPGTSSSPIVPSPLIHEVRTLETDSLLAIPGAGGPPPALPYTHNGVRVAYGAPSLVRPSAIEYQYRIEGRSSEWSDWTSRTERELPNLSPGNYTFAVRARTAYGDTTRTARYAFSVLPPWYRTWWAYAGYGLFALAVVAGAVRWRTRRLRRRQKALEETVEKRTEEIRRQRDQLRELDEAKSRFFANVSHEFRTPLTLIRGPVKEVRERLQQGRLEPIEDAEQLEIAERNTARLQRLIDQILGLARMDAGTYELAARPVELGAVVTRVVQSFEPMAERQQLTIATHTDDCPSEAESVYVDRDALEHILSNLLSNAIKFTPAGGEIEVRVREAETAAEIQVVDTGPGIPEEQEEAIFDRFRQVDDTSTRPQDGAGIGLAFVRDLVDLHGGTITVDSEQGKGTAFTVRLPRGRGHFSENLIADDLSPTDPPPTEEAAPSSRPSTLDSRPSTLDVSPDGASTSDSSFPSTDSSQIDTRKSKLVLVVDDNADVRRYVRSVLEPEFAVLEAADGNEGAQVARERLPDVILADVMMPAMDGHEMTRRLKGDPETEAIPVIMVTARAATQDEVEGLQQGADDYVTKPFDADVLRQRVGGVLMLQERLRRRIEASFQEEGRSAVASEPVDRPAVERRAREVIAEHLTDSDFGVTDLADAMAMSRSTLYRKLKAESDTTPSALITAVRLEQAQELLEAGEPVTQVAYAVGYDTLSTFSAVFHEQVGTPPSTYASTERKARREW